MDIKYPDLPVSILFATVKFTFLTDFDNLVITMYF